MKAFEAGRARLEGLGAQVLGVSPDDVATHKKFAGALGLGFPLLADADKTTAKAYDATSLGGAFFDRKTLVIDKAGLVQYVHRGFPSVDELLAVLRRLEGGSPQPR
jgi:peroxiredoxin Q/BCP